VTPPSVAEIVAAYAPSAVLAGKVAVQRARPLAGEDFVQAIEETDPVGPYTTAVNAAFAALPLFQ